MLEKFFQRGMRENCMTVNQLLEDLKVHSREYSNSGGKNRKFMRTRINHGKIFLIVLKHRSEVALLPFCMLSNCIYDEEYFHMIYSAGGSNATKGCVWWEWRKQFKTFHAFPRDGFCLNFSLNAVAWNYSRSERFFQCYGGYFIRGRHYWKFFFRASSDAALCGMCEWDFYTKRVGIEHLREFEWGRKKNSWDFFNFWMILRHFWKKIVAWKYYGVFKKARGDLIAISIEYFGHSVIFWKKKK